MSAGIVDSGEKETDTKRTLGGVERFELGLSRNFSDNTLARVL